MPFPKIDFKVEGATPTVSGSIEIRPEGGAPAGAYDVRVLLGGDNTDPDDAGLLALRQVADALLALCAGTTNALVVFCSLGASRSPRSAGAFLILHCGWTAEEVMAQLKVEYGQQGIPNGNLLEESVWKWLTAFERKEFPDRVQKRAKRAATIKKK